VELFKKPQAELKDMKNYTFKTTTVDIVGSIPEDPKTKQIVDGFDEQFRVRMEKIIAHSNVKLDASNEACRTRESNVGKSIYKDRVIMILIMVGDLVCDCMCRELNAQIAILSK
jgi:2',3'-cyclic-nucleotide 2'-phosphodiesterase (5'-nucleotidase family)